MKYYKYILIITVCIVITGCGTIFKGSSADLKVNSSPSGATIYVNDINKGITPQTLSLKRNKDYIISFQSEGYEEVKMEINKKFDVGTSVVGNIFSWGILGLLVDMGTGAAYSLEPHDLQANMNELRVAGFIPEDADVNEDDIFVFMITTEEWQKIQDGK
ncbi:MAG: PEGA domain-containing protein [Balneolaceae bacterium]